MGRSHPSSAAWSLRSTQLRLGRHPYYLPKEDLQEVRKKLAHYRKFRRLIHDWIGLTVQIARLKQKRPR
jgi:hypothetical protein